MIKVKQKPGRKSKTSLRDDDSVDNSSSHNIQKALNKKNTLKLNKIVVENFKSFEGRHEIGYFLDFSVVLGPNGSGKSNIIDAICFALGMKTNSLRTKNLKDLIYKKDYEEFSQKKTSYVEIVFLKNGDEIKFKRTITNKGTSDFYYNETKMTVEEYSQRLEDFNIPSKARYFILVQGAIDTMLAKKNDITDTIELLSGSYEHKEDYERVKVELQNLNTEIGKISNEVNSIKEDRNKVKVQIENEEKYSELIDKLNSKLEKTYLFKLAQEDLIIQLERKNLVEMEKSMKIVQDEKKEIIDYVRINEIEVKKFESDTKQIDKDNSEFKSEIEQIENRKLGLEEKIKLLESQIFTKVSMLNQHKVEKKKKEEKKANLIKITKEVESDIEQIKMKIDKDETSLSQNLNKAQLDEYKKISTQLQIETFELGKIKEKIQFELTECHNQKSMQEKNFQKIENEKQNLEKEFRAANERIEQEAKKIKNIEDELFMIRNNLANKENEKVKIDDEFHSIKSLLNEKLNQLARLENDSTESLKKKKITELMNKDSNVFGFMYELIIPLQKKLELPVKVSLLKYLNYLVVEKSETAKTCSDFLKGKEINADVLVLENIPVQELNESIRLKLGNLGNLLVDLIDCKKKGLKNALTYFLKDMVLCYDKDNVTKLKEKGFNSIILLDGTLFKKGTISGGNYRNLDQFSFNSKSNNFQEINKLKNEIESLTRNLKSIEEKIEDQKELNTLRVKIVEKESSVEINKRNIQMLHIQVQKLKGVMDQKEISLNEASKDFEKITKDYDELISQLEKITRQKNEMKEKFFSNFMEKYHFKTLDDFEQFSLGEIKRLSEELKQKEERLLRIQSQIENLDTKDELADKTEKSLKEDKETVKEAEVEIKKLNEEKKKTADKWEEFKGSKNENYKRINQIKEILKIKQTELDKVDKRVRGLLKSKIESEHKITSAMENKKTIIEESKLNADNILKELGDVYNASSVFVSFNINVDRYVIASDKIFGNTNFIIDYQNIERKTKLEGRTIEEIKEKIESCKNKITTMLKEVEKYAKICAIKESETNKLKDKEGELSRKKKDLSLQVQTLIAELDSKKEEFESIKSNRKEKFETFFNKLANELTEVYKELTKTNTLGGSAYIYNTNEDEPYLGTVCYLPTPPGKRVIYDIDQLSGGEKTIAILSLIISIQKISKTPFIILDEIDAYLDPEHESILENLFKSKNDFQLIIVTHKSNIFRSAHALIGTYFNKQKYSSIPITIDMTKL